MGINAQNLKYVWPFPSGTNAYVEPVTQRHVADRALSAQGGERSFAPVRVNGGNAPFKNP